MSPPVDACWLLAGAVIALLARAWHARRIRHAPLAPTRTAVILPRASRMPSDELPTLRLITLRRLVHTLRPPLVFTMTSQLAAIAGALERASGSVAVIVDDSGTLRGTVRLADIRDRRGDAPVAAVMTRDTPVLEPEHDIEAARSTMQRRHVDRVLVASATGALLGVVTDRDLPAARIAP